MPEPDPETLKILNYWYLQREAWLDEWARRSEVKELGPKSKDSCPVCGDLTGIRCCEFGSDR